MSRISGFARLKQLAAVEADRAATIVPGGSGISRRIDIAVTRLAAADLADDAEGLAGVDVKRYALDRAHHAVAGAEPGLQICDLAGSRRPRLWRMTTPPAGSAIAHAPREPRVERVAQPVAEQVHRQHGDAKEDRREDTRCNGFTCQSAAAPRP